MRQFQETNYLTHIVQLFNVIVDTVSAADTFCKGCVPVLNVFTKIGLLPSSTRTSTVK